MEVNIGTLAYVSEEMARKRRCEREYGQEDEHEQKEEEE